VLTVRRTALTDTEVGGPKIAADEKVVMFYRSGNQDESVFTDPLPFDIARSPHTHVAFGGGGPRFGLGSNLARTQLRARFDEILRRIPDFTVGSRSTSRATSSTASSGYR
jgi:cytochrome P450